MARNTGSLLAIALLFVGAYLLRPSLDFVSPRVHRSADMTALPKSSRIAIVGGGVGGFTLANLLQQQGFEQVTVLERCGEVETRGGHISIMPANIGGAGSVMETLGLGEKLEEFKSAAGNVKSLNNGVVVSDRKMSMGPRIMRETLQRLLLDKLSPGTVQFGKVVKSFDEQADHVEMVFDDGTIETFDLVVAADGIHSGIAQQLFPEHGKKFSGFVSYVLLAKGEFVPDSFYDHHVHGDGQGFAVRCVPGFSSEGRWDMAAFTVRSDVPRSNNWDAEGSKEEIEQLLEAMEKHCEGGCPSCLRDLVAKSERVMRWGIYEHMPKPTWLSPGGKVALLGDAAHAMAPYLGMGAQAAMLDAHVLVAELLQDQPLTSALQAYEAQRKPLCESIVAQSSFEGSSMTSFGTAAAYRQAIGGFKTVRTFAHLPQSNSYVRQAAGGVLKALQLGHHASEAIDTFFGASHVHATPATAKVM